MRNAGKRGLPARLRAAVIAAALAAGLGGVAFAAAGAGASVSPTTVVTPASVGVAGAYVAPNNNQLANGDHITGVRETFTLDPAMEYKTSNGQYAAFGLELCRYAALTGNNDRVSLFVQYSGANGIFNVYAEHDTTGTCLSGLQGTGAQLLDTIPVGAVTYLAATVDPDHVIHFVDSDVSAGTGGNRSFGGFSWGYNRGGFGTELDANTLTTPANIPVMHATSVAVRDNKGWTDYNRRGLTRIDTVRVVSATSAGGVLLNTSIIRQSGLLIDMGQESSS